MALAILKQKRLILRPDSAGTRLTPRQFDQAEFKDGWRYELINGVLIVSPIPAESESDPNEELGHLLRDYRDRHPQGHSLNGTLPERIIKTGPNRRRPDRIIWAGLGRPARKGDLPSIVAEFVSKGKRNFERDYIIKRHDYMAIKVQEYWVFNRFERTRTVFSRQGKRVFTRVLREGETYTTPLLPGFELPLAKLFARADSWEQESEEEALDDLV